MRVLLESSQEYHRGDMDHPIDSLEAATVPATPATVWTFIRVRTARGLEGVGEATLSNAPAGLAAAAALLAGSARGASADPGERWAWRTLAAAARTTLADAAIASAVDQALWDIAGRRRGAPIHALLGPATRTRIPAYANVNRRTRDRSPAGFAASARAAEAAGFAAIKIAPFDDVTPATAGAPAGRPALAAALERIAATRAALRSDAALMVDCHWRLDETTAAAIVPELARQGVSWLECPIAETPAAVPALRRLRSAANDRGIRLAGCEQMIGVAGFEPYLAGGAYDVIMPDAKYAGGLDEMLAIARLAARHGVQISPHNPSGPICHLATLHVAAVAEALLHVETQFDETPLFAAIVDGDPALPRDGFCALPEGPGLGARLADPLPDPAAATRAGN
jgi:galactonate dehydratase